MNDYQMTKEKITIELDSKKMKWLKKQFKEICQELETGPKIDGWTFENYIEEKIMMDIEMHIKGRHEACECNIKLKTAIIEEVMKYQKYGGISKRQLFDKLGSSP